MGSPKPPKDNSAQVAQINANAAREAREAETARKAEERGQFNNRVSGAYSSALTDANDYFTGRGLDASQYAGAISNRANRLKTTIPDLDQAPGSYFDNLGQQVYDQETSNFRSGKNREIRSFAPEGFASRRITNDVDDAFIESILAEQRATAEQYTRNLLDRGVITSAGFDAANTDLERQTIGARSRLNEVGLGVLERGRTDARNLASEARQRVGNLELGDAFDSFQYQSDIDSGFGTFFDNLGQNLREGIGGDLFSTSGLANIAGAAQGAQNTNALGSIFTDPADDEEDDVDENAVF